MNDIKLNELSSEELTNMLINTPEVVNDILSQIGDTSKLEELINFLINNPEFANYIISKIKIENKSRLEELHSLLVTSKYDPKQPSIDAVLSAVNDQLYKLELKSFKEKYASFKEENKRISRELDKYVGNPIKE